MQGRTQSKGIKSYFRIKCLLSVNKVIFLFCFFKKSWWQNVNVNLKKKEKRNTSKPRIGISRWFFLFPSLQNWTGQLIVCTVLVSSQGWYSSLLFIRGVSTALCLLKHSFSSFFLLPSFSPSLHTVFRVSDQTDKFSLASHNEKKKKEVVWCWWFWVNVTPKMPSKILHKRLRSKVRQDKFISSFTNNKAFQNAF